MENELNVIIAGHPNSGKSTMMLLLKKFLFENGFNVELKNTDPVQFTNTTLVNFDKKVNAVKSKTKINLSEVNIRPEPIINNGKKKD